ncbi:MAG: hypothetical protein JWO96_140 [Candidatus Saccharibacteria bacterium]|nr:hypothetical protein [Candidatus Saccharibacteria bacterium]
MTLKQIVDRAVELFHQEEFVDGDVFEASDAWYGAVEELVQTDEDALALLSEILNDPTLKARIKYWYDEDGDESFAKFINGALTSYSDSVTFDELVIAGVENYDTIIADRKSRAPVNT